MAGKYVGLIAVCAMLGSWTVTATEAQQVVSAAPSVRFVTLDLRDEPLESALQRIAQQAGLTAVYGKTVAQSQARVTLAVRGIPAVTAFHRALEGTKLRAVVMGDNVVFEPASDPVTATDGTITGRVVHAKTKQPIAGATITIGSATTGVTSSQDGTFRITAAAGEYDLHVKAIGMVRQTKHVAVPEEGTITLEFVLEPSASVLDEVIVTGTVVATERKAIPNPITVITAEEIEKRGITRIEEFFRGEVPGVLAIDDGAMRFSDNDLGGAASSQMYVRGVSGFGSGTVRPGRTNPLKTYVDGVELLDPAMLGLVDPQSIERIEIITGPQAATIYGSGAMGGVMQIFTKRGAGMSRTEVTLRLQYGILQNNVSDGLTPAHQDAIAVQGDMGPALTYNANLSYQSRGQWQPNLYTRTVGTSLGLRTNRGPFSIDGSASFTSVQNGTWGSAFGLRVLAVARGLSGDWARFQAPVARSRRVGRSSGHTLTLNADYHPGKMWHHRFTIGRNQTDLAYDPLRPNFERPADSLYKHASSVGSRVTANYNMTFLPQQYGILSSHLTVGVNGSSGTRIQVSGTAAALTSTSYLSPAVTRPLSDKSWGVFTRWQVGLLEQLYLTFGLRAETNAAYGRDHKVDWTPTNGMTYTVSIGEVTVKLLGSYGKSTRAPGEQLRLARTVTTTAYNELDTYTVQLEAPELTPEYSRGPQGGMELYWGGRGSLTLNRYVQKVTDLIQSQVVDSIHLTHRFNGLPETLQIRQYQNVATIKNHGWESTGTFNIGVLSFRGTYSWMDSRVIASPIYPPGFMFLNVPTHTAHMGMSYAHGGTSFSLDANYVGAHNTQKGHHPLHIDARYKRIQAYVIRKENLAGNTANKGYMKSNFSLQHRINLWATATVRITNLGDHYGSDGSAFDPTLGRQTMLGVSMRFPRR